MSWWRGNEADGRQWGEKLLLGLCCHLRSAGTLRVSLRVARGGRQGAERAHLLPLRIDHSIPTHSMQWHGCLDLACLCLTAAGQTAPRRSVITPSLWNTDTGGSLSLTRPT